MVLKKIQWFLDSIIAVSTRMNIYSLPLSMYVCFRKDILKKNELSWRFDANIVFLIN
jgi:hypothetical protein